MGAGRRAGFSASSLRAPLFLNLPVGELGSVIFGCTRGTYDECVNQLIFGLPQPHYSYIKNIHPGMPLFLFNYDDRKLYGIYEAASPGALNIRPNAWTGSKTGITKYPAQVQVRLRCYCPSLPEKVFKEAIAANYRRDTPNHFYFELNCIQTAKLLSLFTGNASEVGSQAGTSACTQSGHEKSVMDAWHNARPFEPSPAPTSPSLSEGRAKTPEDWDNRSANVDDETPAPDANSLDAVSRSSEAVAGKFLDVRASVALPNGKPSGIEEDRRKAESEGEIIQWLPQMKQKGKMQSSMEMGVELLRVQGDLQGEASSSSFIESTEFQDSAHTKSAMVQEFSRVETTNVQDSLILGWERLARETCLQEQTMLREERGLLREKFEALDGPVAKAIDKNLEISASAIAQMREDQIKLKHVMDEAMSHGELLKELDQLRKKNACLENTQVEMQTELDMLGADVARLSQQLQQLSLMLPGCQINQMPHQ